MQFPAVDDTIVAVSSGWCAAPLGIVRLSGADPGSVLTGIGLGPPPAPGNGSPRSENTRLFVSDAIDVPATLFWFFAPRSYTGQTVVEIHTIGNLCLLREISERLIRAGARRALPGEFTARAFLSGRLDADQVDSVLELIRAKNQAGAREAAREIRHSRTQQVADVRSRLLDLLASIEAGIDFVDEEDVRFVSDDEVRAALAEISTTLASIASTASADRHSMQPHVALVGPPNAGKSTLFNALLGHERAIVSPVVGTTRDVLSAEISLGGVSAVLQDCAGLGVSADELEAASHVATEEASELADLVLWVHAATEPWSDDECAACRAVPSGRRILVLSKCDCVEAGSARASGVPFDTIVQVSGLRGDGLDKLRSEIQQKIGQSDSVHSKPTGVDLAAAASSASHAARALETGDGSNLLPELVALELRSTIEALDDPASPRSDDEVLSRIFSQFCIGK